VFVSLSVCESLSLFEPPIAVDVESVGEVLCVTVPEQHSKPYSFGGKFFLREGATSQQISRDEIREFSFKEGLIHFDETPCRDYDLKNDLTPENWANFAKRARIPESLDPRTALSNLHLIKDSKMISSSPAGRGGGEGLRQQMTHAGAWLLTDDITRFTWRAGVTCALFRGTTNVHILDRKDFIGDLYSIYEDCMGYMQAKLNTALIPHARGRDERLELPEDALREAIVNAIAHRDYRSTANVQVHIYHDRLEIISPGGLPAGMRESDLGRKSVPRNPLLFGIFYRMDLVEQIGSGIKRIRDLCHDYGVAEPKFEVSDDWVTTIFARHSAEQLEGQETQITGEASGEVSTKLALSRHPVTPEVTPHVTPEVRFLRTLSGEMTRQQLQITLELKDDEHFRKTYLLPALQAGLIEMTIPDKPRSSKQKYCLTAKGRALLDSSRGSVP